MSVWHYFSIPIPLPFLLYGFFVVVVVVERELPDELLLQTCSLNSIFVQLWRTRLALALLACHFVHAGEEESSVFSW